MLQVCNGGCVRGQEEFKSSVGMAWNTCGRCVKGSFKVWRRVTIMGEGRKEGREEGRKEGRKRGRKERRILGVGVNVRWVRTKKME